MSPEEIIEAYNVLANEVSDQVAQDAAKIGNSQASLGTMAERVARPTGQTSGLANYTYNRTLRPTVDSLTTSLITAGKGQALDKNLLDSLLAAKQKYERAKNAYTVASSTPKQNPVYTESTDKTATGEQIPYTPAGTVTGTARRNETKRNYITPEGAVDGWFFDVVVADGNGGAKTYSYFARTADEAKQMYYREHGTPSGADGWGFSGGGTAGGGSVVGGSGR